ncbi:zf-HC2 domain-containing protein [Streptomyces sp. ST2-7A]|uniref:zf-HC2 domain-containing protein n=1 Tax=Streptomyces sp. ST2-7A TaxID=2907214 RepID=UPI001F2C22BF|nr:zf-HC2 domain-containing protein [Streptomyces sp. ST2-7A]MCE7083442.1 zf-HC2 domain-containing protein [Streptomyces sp. ST2-7A]
MTSEHHLGDRLAAFIDGELSIDDRERVLAHVATCAGCRAEVDAQRRVKSYCAGSALPPPPPALLARLQGLPTAGADTRSGVGPFGGPRAPMSSRPRFPGIDRPAADPVPSSPLTAGGAGVLRPPGHGFRIHRPEPARGRGPRRFAFAAAGAFSLAAVAIGGVLGAGALGGSPGSASGPMPGASVAAGGSAAPSAGARSTAAREALRGVPGTGAPSRSGQHRADTAPPAGALLGPTPHLDPPSPAPLRPGFVPVARAVTAPQPSPLPLPLPLPLMAEMFPDLSGSGEPSPLLSPAPVGATYPGPSLGPNNPDHGEAFRIPTPVGDVPVPAATAGHSGVPSPR